MNKLISFVKKFTKEEIPEINKVEKIGRNYFLMEPELKNQVMKIDIKPEAAGLFFAEIKDGKIRPGFPLLEAIAKKNHRRAIINRKGETMFLFKNNIFEESIISCNAEKDQVLIENETGEVLGYGELAKSRDGRTIINHRFDRSDFLKRER